MRVRLYGVADPWRALIEYFPQNPRQRMSTDARYLRVTYQIRSQDCCGGKYGGLRRLGVWGMVIVRKRVLEYEVIWGHIDILVVVVRRLSRRWKLKTRLAGPSPTSPMKAEITISPISNKGGRNIANIAVLWRSCWFRTKSVWKRMGKTRISYAFLQVMSWFYMFSTCSEWAIEIM